MLLIIIPIFPEPAFCQQEVPLYDIVSNSKSNNLKENVSYDDQGNVQRVSGVLNLRLIVFSPKNPCGTGIIICPVGGYKGLNIENARFIAKRLNQIGITAFILIYRLHSAQLQEDPSVNCLQDVQEAFRLIRKQVRSWGLSPDKIGLWGSSAGGHLAAMASTHYHIAYEKDKTTDGLHPDFLVLAWPVISFRPGYISAGLIELLFGKDPADKQIAHYSPEEWVDRAPPTFLVHASDDKTVPVNNSIVFYQALKKAGVPAKMHIYENGGHGFGISPEIKESWMEQLFIWMEYHELIKKTLIRKFAHRKNIIKNFKIVYERIF